MKAWMLKRLVVSGDNDRDHEKTHDNAYTVETLIPTLCSRVAYMENYSRNIYVNLMHSGQVVRMTCNFVHGAAGPNAGYWRCTRCTRKEIPATEWCEQHVDGAWHEGTNSRPDINETSAEQHFKQFNPEIRRG